MAKRNFADKITCVTFEVSDVTIPNNGYTTKITKDKEGPIPERALFGVTSLFLQPLRFITSNNSDK